MSEFQRLIDRAQALIRLTAHRRPISEQTIKSYVSVFEKMWKTKNLDPLRAGDSLDTYHHRRAAMQWGVTRILLLLIRDIGTTVGDKNADELQKLEFRLRKALELIEPALVLEPPMQPGELPWKRPPSRWQQAPGQKPQRGAKSKKHVLRELPPDWGERLWEGTPADWKYREVLAVHLIVPVRPEELVPGARPSGHSPGVTLELRSENCLVVTFAPVKSHDGLYGTELTEICLDPKVMKGPAQFLAGLCQAAGGCVIVSAPSKNAFRKALEDLGRKALPGITTTISAYVCRQQLLADLKVTFGAGGKVAAAAGHCTDRTQSRYGYVQNGRKLHGYIGISARREPVVGNVERARRLFGRELPRRRV